MAIFLRLPAARLGIATGKDLAAGMPRLVSAWTPAAELLLSEIAIARAIWPRCSAAPSALNLLFRIPIFWGVLITRLRRFRVAGAAARPAWRRIEAVIVVLVTTIGVCYFIELFVLPETRPDLLQIGRAILRPGLSQRHDHGRDRHRRRHR